MKFDDDPSKRIKEFRCILEEIREKNLNIDISDQSFLKSLNDQAMERSFLTSAQLEAAYKLLDRLLSFKKSTQENEKIISSFSKKRECSNCHSNGFILAKKNDDDMIPYGFRCDCHFGLTYRAWPLWKNQVDFKRVS